MKRFLSILASVGLVATASTAVVSCSAVNKHKSVSLIASRAYFVGAAYPSADLNQSDNDVDKNYIKEIDIAGIGFDKIKDFNQANLEIVPNSKNESASPKKLNITSAIVDDSYTTITVTLSKDSYILIPKKSTDTYTITYNDRADNISLSTTLSVQPVNDPK